MGRRKRVLESAVKRGEAKRRRIIWRWYWLVSKTLQIAVVVRSRSFVGRQFEYYSQTPQYRPKAMIAMSQLWKWI